MEEGDTICRQEALRWSPRIKVPSVMPTIRVTRLARVVFFAAVIWGMHVFINQLIESAISFKRNKTDQSFHAVHNLTDGAHMFKRLACTHARTPASCPREGNARAIRW